MLGIGMQEMLVIGIAALLIFGPGKLPEVMGQAGKLYRDFRKMTGELTGEFEKTVAEARELGNSLTGDMQKEVNAVTSSVKRDLGTGSKAALNNPNLQKNKTGSTSTAKSGSSASKTTTASKSGSSSARSTSSSSTSSSRTTSSASSTTSTTSTTAKKPAPPVATKEDPAADISLFEPVEPKRERRARKATPSVITDPTPRAIFAAAAEDATGTALVAELTADDPLARARQRRRNAGYAQRSA